MIIFPSLALGLAAMGILSLVVMKNIKNASARRAQIVIVTLDPTRSTIYHNLEFYRRPHQDAARRAMKKVPTAGQPTGLK